MKESKNFSMFLLSLNGIGVGCLIYYAIPYFMHNTQILYSEAMLPAERWDLAGMTLTIGIIPLFIVNLLGYLFVKGNGNRFLFFLPSGICIAIVAHYWITSLTG